MSRLVEFRVGEAGDVVLIEIDEPEATGPGRVGRVNEAVETSAKSFGEALAQVRPAIDTMLETLKGLSSRPDEISAEFGIKLGAKMGAFLASADSEAQFKVALKWKAAR
jgi:hypothetical protein